MNRILLHEAPDDAGHPRDPANPAHPADPGDLLADGWPRHFIRTATLSRKGQITIPIWARDRMGVRAGQRLRLRVEERRLVVEPLPGDAPAVQPEDELICVAEAIKALSDRAVALAAEAVYS